MQPNNISPVPARNRDFYRRPLRWVRGQIGLCILPVLLSGCAWHTGQAEHLFGPTRFRFTESPAGEVLAFQSWHAPFLFEGGNQWGLSLGFAQRLSLAPEQQLEAPGKEPAMPQPGRPLPKPRTDRWRWSWLYRRVPLARQPEFVWRSSLGLHARAGVEENALSLGYTSMTLMSPLHDGLYELDFSSRRPLDATLTMKPEPLSDRLQRTETNRKEQP